MLKVKLLISLFILIQSFSSCAIYKKAELPKQDGIQGYTGDDATTIRNLTIQNEKRLNAFKHEETFIGPQDDLEWGLALSGGGVRSAAYNMGALKALYDIGIFDDMQIISSVSGGGYLSYWVYTNYYNYLNNGEKFGYFSFDDSVFLKRLCEQRYKANFFTIKQYSATLFKTPIRAFYTYHRNIRSSFGNNTKPNLPLTLINDAIKNREAPYPIINTTIAAKKNEDWLSRVFEFTPAHRGNPEIGFDFWDRNNSFSLNEAITISGAALKFKLMRRTANYTDSIKTKFISLSDGGHSENLGAISLIRRGVKNIIIVDAEHNVDYSFDGYKILKMQLLKELNLDLKIKEIDDFIENKEKILKASSYKGTIKGLSNNEIQVYYVKMSMDSNISIAVNDEVSSKSGFNLNQNLKQMLKCEDSPINIEKTSDRCNCLSNYEKMDLTELSKHWVRSYSNFIDNNKKANFLGYKFPHTTTIDQSYYKDQFAAFVGLGYLQGLDLKRFIDK